MAAEAEIATRKGVEGVRALREQLAADVPAFADATATGQRATAEIAELRRALRERRSLMDLDQQAVAERMGVSQSAISKIENGEGDIGYKTVFRYAAALGLKPVVTFVPETGAIFADDISIEPEQALIIRIVERARERAERDIEDLVALDQLGAIESPGMMPYSLGTLTTVRTAPGARNSKLGSSVSPSKDLARITGSDPLPRSQVVSKVWDHIRKNNLQNPQNKREIVADGALRKIFGKDRVSMFEMNKHLSRHLSIQPAPAAKSGSVSRSTGSKRGASRRGKSD